MPKLIVKIKHVKASKSVRGYVNYVATREGVDKMINLDVLIGKPTKKQIEFIDKLLEESPDVKESFEYEDYIINPTKQNASALITILAESNPELFESREKYLSYIATRPNVEKHSEHGLFGREDDVDLGKVKNEIAGLKSVIWTPIISLKREDAYCLGYDNAEMWRDLIRAKQMNIAEEFGIPFNDFNWYGAFHNEAGHPHLHMVVYSTGSKHGFVTEEKIENIKSMLANEIFKNEMYAMYDQKTQAREKITGEIKERLKAIADRIRDRDFSDSEVCKMVEDLSESLKLHKGKKQYGYLSPKIKKEVDEIFKKMSEDDDIQEMYKEWCNLQTQIIRIYHDKEIIFPALYENSEFKKIKNAIIKEATEIGNIRQLVEEPDTDVKPPELNEKDEYSPIEFTTKSSKKVKAEEEKVDTNSETKQFDFEIPNAYICDYRSGYRTARMLLYNQKDYPKAYEALCEQAMKGNVPAILDLAKMYQSGLFVGANEEKAEELLTVALDGYMTLEKNNPSDFFEYQIARILSMNTNLQDRQEAIKWFEKSAEKGNSFAMFSLGNIYYYGIGTDVNMEKAFDCFYKSANKNCTHSYYKLGDMYRRGLGCEADERLSDRWFSKTIKFYEYNPEKLDSYGSYRLGRLYEKGWGTDKDIDEAKDYYLKACAEQNPNAEFAMARIYYYEGNDEECERYIRLAEEHGNEYARDWYENAKAQQKQYNSQTIVESTTALFCRLASIIENDTDKKTDGFNKTIVDSKERKQTIKKKQSLGIKMG